MIINILLHYVYTCQVKRTLIIINQIVEGNALKESTSWIYDVFL